MITISSIYAPAMYYSWKVEDQRRRHDEDRSLKRNPNVEKKREFQTKRSNSGTWIAPSTREKDLSQDRSDVNDPYRTNAGGL